MGQAQVYPGIRPVQFEGQEDLLQNFLRAVSDADVALFGEQHNNPIAHWSELEVAQELAARGPLMMGAEMIEADNQAVLDSISALRATTWK